MEQRNLFDRISDITGKLIAELSRRIEFNDANESLEPFFSQSILCFIISVHNIQRKWRSNSPSRPS